MNQNYPRIATIAFAIAFIILGVQHFMFEDFIAGRAPAWPESIPGKTVFAYVTGLLLVGTGLAVIIGKKARLLLVISGFVILVWAGFRNIVEILMNPEYGGLLTNTMKSLTMGSGAFVIAYALRDDDMFENLLPKLASLGRIFLGLFFLVGGVQHFIFADFVKFLVPAWIPAPTFWTYFAGVALILAGISLITQIKIQLASLLGGIMVGIWLLVLHIPRAITMANQNEWTAVCEALAVSCILFTIYFSVVRIRANAPAIQ